MIWYIYENDNLNHNNLANSICPECGYKGEIITSFNKKSLNKKQLNSWFKYFKAGLDNQVCMKKVIYKDIYFNSLKKERVCKICGGRFINKNKNLICFSCKEHFKYRIKNSFKEIILGNLNEEIRRELNEN